MTGDGVLLVALLYEIYRVTGSTLGTAGVVIASFVPSIAVGSIAGVFVDRWDRRRLMVVVDLALAVSLLPLLAVPLLGVWIAYVVLVIQSSVRQFFDPAEVALVPSLLGDDRDLVTANSMIGVARHMARISGPALGGIIVALGGLAAATVADTVSFAVSALLIAAIRVPTRRLQPSGTGQARVRSALARVAREWRDGLQVTLMQPPLRAVAIFLVITRIGDGLTLTLFVPWVTDVLQADSSGYAALLSAEAIGGVLGAVALAWLGHRSKPLVLLIVGGIAFGVIDLAIFTYPLLYPIITPALIGMIVVGVPGAAVMAGIATLQQTMPPATHRGRVVAATAAMGAFGSLLGALIAGVLGELVPVVALLVVQGSGYIVAGIVAARVARGPAQARPADV